MYVRIETRSIWASLQSGGGLIHKENGDLQINAGESGRFTLHTDEDLTGCSATFTAVERSTKKARIFKHHGSGVLVRGSTIAVDLTEVDTEDLGGAYLDWEVRVRMPHERRTETVHPEGKLIVKKSPSSQGES